MANLPARVRQTLAKHHAPYTPYATMPSSLIEAIVSTEDKRFWYDPLVHPRAAERRQAEVLNLMLAHGLITAAQARHAELTLVQEITNTGS